MAHWIEPVTLEGEHVVLEPLASDHAEALAEATADGELWKLVNPTRLGRMPLLARLCALGSGRVLLLLEAAQLAHDLSKLGERERARASVVPPRDDRRRRRSSPWAAALRRSYLRPPRRTARSSN